LLHNGAFCTQFQFTSETVSNRITEINNNKAKDMSFKAKARKTQVQGLVYKGEEGRVLLVLRLGP